MLRTAMLLSVALPALLAAQASAAALTTPLRGSVRALSIGADAVLVARQPPAGKLVVERMVAGSPAAVVLTTVVDNDDDELALAASGEALAFSVNPAAQADDFGASRVFIGPAAGPLREVSVCDAGLIASPVSVLGSRIAWRDGSCGEPATSPRSVTPAAIMVAGADPNAPQRRLPVAGPGLPVSLVLGPGDSGLVGTALPSFFNGDSEARAFGPTAIGAILATEQGRFVSPVGILADGTRVFMISSGDDTLECPVELFTLARGSGERHALSLGGCPQRPSSPAASTGLRVTADRIVALVADPARSDGGPSVTSVVSVNGDGGDRRVLARGTYRAPLGVAADGDRVAWWQHGCRTDDEIVSQPVAETATASVASCRVRILTRRARISGGRIAVRLRCPAGCGGSAISRRRVLADPQPFSFGRGTHTLRVPVSLGKRRGARVQVLLLVDNGPAQSASISVRR